MTVTPIRIVPLDLHCDDHCDALLRLLDEYARHPHGGGRGLSQTCRRTLIPGLRQRSDFIGLLAFMGDDAVGLLNGFEGFSTFNARPLLNIHDLMVSGPYRQRGIGQLLLAGAERIARERGYCKLTLEVLEHNQQARKAYCTFGFHGYALDPQLGQALFWEKPLPK
jgi:ribosomal protein S18 acetylase RimI-like enzyme